MTKIFWQKYFRKKKYNLIFQGFKGRKKTPLGLKGTLRREGHEDVRKQKLVKSDFISLIVYTYYYFIIV